MDNGIWSGAILLAIGVITFVLVVAAEAGVIAGVRERALREPTESRVDALRRFYQERQLTLSSLALAHNLALVGITAVIVFVVLREWDDSLPVLAATVVATVGSVMLLQTFAKWLVREDPERWQRALKPFVAFVRIAFRGPVLLLDTPMGVVQRTWHRRHQPVNGGAEELVLLTEMEEAGAALEEEERQMIRGVMEMEFTAIREVMVPRPDMIAVDVTEGFEKVAHLMVDRGFSRLPIYEENVDNIIGIAHGKEIMRHLARNGAQPNLRDILRPAQFVPESKKVHETLAEMRENQISIAMVVDEYGGTAGLVTLEDLLEEIVGEIRDEFDVEEQEVQPLTPDELIVDARVGIDELSEMFDISIQKNDFDSVGGFIVHELGRMPSVGDHVRVNGISLHVISVAGRRVKKVRVTKVSRGEEGGEAPQR